MSETLLNNLRRLFLFLAVLFFLAGFCLLVIKSLLNPLQFSDPYREETFGHYLFLFQFTSFSYFILGIFFVIMALIIRFIKNNKYDSKF